MGFCITNIALKNFRNYSTFTLSKVEKLTILVGSNAIGKTNVIEGVQLLTALTSFRHPITNNLIKEGFDYSYLNIHVSDNSRELDISLQIREGQKNYFLNQKKRKTSDLKGLVPSVTFTPDDLELVKGSSTSRRRALDILGTQLSANHYVIKQDYEKVIRYKNCLLKEEASQELIESINESLITCGAQLSYYRASLLEKLSPIIERYYDAISQGKEKLHVCYIPSWEAYNPSSRETFIFDRDHARACITQALQNYQKDERIRHRSLIGPHIDHIEFFLGEKNASIFGSQGQQRSIVLALKLAEVSLIQEILKQKPILLLDDVMSELDISRREILMSFIEKDIQTFITTTNLLYFNKEILDRASVVQLPLKEK